MGNRGRTSNKVLPSYVLAMPFTECPLCSKRYPQPFIAAHAAACNPSVKRPRPEPRTGIRKCLTYRTSPPKSGPPSETGAPGFHVFPDVFSDIEANLLHHIQVTPPQWRDYRFRKVKNYGPPYILRKRRFDFSSTAAPQIPIPAYVRDLILPHLRRLPILSKFTPNQLSVAEYPVPGGHILPHNDCENGIIHTAVVGVCLAARCTMTLILRARYNGLGKDVKKDVVLPPGTVYVMSGDSLRVWEHAIFPRNIDSMRYSLTFRDVSPFTTGPSETQIKGASQETREGEASPGTQVRSHSTTDHVSVVNTGDKAATQLRVKRRRLVQQRLI